jgi:S-adenosylhomocysteine hydrolase
MSMGDYRVADISLADFGRKEISLAEVEVSQPACVPE